MPSIAIGRSPRAGGTTFQVLSFLAVAALGMWLGAEYVGVDIEHLAYTALDEAEVLEHLPEAWRPRAPLPALGDAEGQVRFEERSLELRGELGDLREQVAAMRAGGQQADAEASELLPNKLTNSPASRRQATLAYWTRLRQITTEVAELHDGVEHALTPESAANVFRIRGRAFDYGSRAIDSVDTAGVDKQAIDAGYRIAKWYRSGADLYDRANGIWEGRVQGEVQRDQEESLDKAKEHHARAAGLVREQTARTEETLMRRYAVEFPVLSI